MWKKAMNHIAISIDDNDDKEQVEIESHFRLIDWSIPEGKLAILGERTIKVLLSYWEIICQWEKEKMNYAARGSYSNYTATIAATVRLLLNIFSLSYSKTFFFTSLV